MSKITTLIVSTALIWTSVAMAGDDAGIPDAPTADALVFFETQVRPLLAKHCYECHSNETGAENGALILESAAGIAAGGSRGTMFSSESPEDSLLFRVLDYRDPDLQMPPDGKLSADELEILLRWIREGAALPEYKSAPRAATSQIDFAAGRKFWSFQPLQHVDPPPLKNHWIRRPMDAFVLEKLQSHDLNPNPEADRNTWLRRVTFDVIGLPPSSAELETFKSDQSSEAYEHVVDRLLASPHYGERWARVWLDLARYTDYTPEWQSPTDRGWIYRDWVIRVLNENLPFDRFVRLQLAADLIPDAAPEDQAALGFLGLSPTYWKELQLAPAVIEQIVADEWDERLDAVSRTFLGLTVSCARCHDHKFDPISTQDYYALAGVFASSQLDERPLLPQTEIETVRTAKKRISELEDQLKKLTDSASAEAEEIRKSIADIRTTTPHIDLPWAHVLREASLYVMPQGEDRTRLEYRESEPRDLPVFRRGNPSNPGEIVPRRFLTVLQSEPVATFTHGSGRAELADSMFTHAAGLVARVFVNRIWDQHFNAGLVGTPSDFGAQGDRPTHPRLLEYLASEFVAHGWDLKWLHREILLSATYRQSSGFRPDADAVDPANQLLWRMNRRRLDIEMWRDATLAATGRLDPAAGGPSQPVDDLKNVRRTIYSKIEREEMNGVLRMYDFPEASSHSPRREHTTTPLQQLFVLNSPWMEQQADNLWQRLKPLESNDARIAECYRLLFAREVTDPELTIAHAFLADDAGGERKWKDYLQAMLGLNEFHFVD
ncbi:MAG: PSD1 and planctomycete cytochrome C domain-containing protein [Planctomycetaceae bacterium]